MNLLNKSPLEKSTENIRSKIIDTIIWRKSKENRFLNHALKNQLVLERIRDKKAKGVIKMKTFIKIYLREYENTKFSKETDNIPFISPSIVKIFKEEVSIEIWELIFEINVEKQIVSLNKFSPILRIKRETVDIKSINNSIIKKEEFIQIPNRSIFIKKLEGLSIRS